MLGVLQENLLVLLSFDDQRCLVIRNTVDIGLFGGQYRLIASRIYDYIDKYKVAPKTHLPDILDDKINGDNKREGELYEDVISSIHAAHTSINAEYIMSQLETFVRRQSLRTIAVDLAKALQRDTEDSLDEADKLIRSATKTSLSLFDPGLRLGDKERSLDFLNVNQDSFATGIEELDRRGYGPTRKELWLLIANTKGGKTWSLIHLARMAIVHRLRVVHITLEMSEERAAQRYFQAFFAMSKRKEKFITTRFQSDELGRINGFDEKVVIPELYLDDPGIQEKLEKKIDKARGLNNIIIKQFPTGQLTVPQLRAYLDNLETTERFIPDLLVLDYPDLMKVDKANYRLSLDEIYKDVRGIGVERNMAIAAVSQSNRSASKSKVVGTDNVAEAYTKIAHADVAITLSQTPAEHALGLARLFVGAGRNDADKITVVISQNLGTGQFVIDSHLMKGNYFGLLPKDENEEE